MLLLWYCTFPIGSLYHLVWSTGSYNCSVLMQNLSLMWYLVVSACSFDLVLVQCTVMYSPITSGTGIGTVGIQRHIVLLTVTFQPPPFSIGLIKYLNGCLPNWSRWKYQVWNLFVWSCASIFQSTVNLSCWFHYRLDQVATWTAEYVMIWIVYVVRIGLYPPIVSTFDLAW